MSKENPKKKQFDVWPRVPNKPYGPRPKQKLLFIEDLPLVDTWEKTDTGELVNIKRMHTHPVDICVFFGGARAGKTAAATARVISYLMKNPGSLAVIGATNFPLLQRTVLKEWGDRFKRIIPWDMASMPGSPLLRKPTQNDKRAIFRNGSQALFLHLDDPAILRGMDCSIIHFEESALLPGAEAYEELVRRLSGKNVQVRQLLLTSNPEGGGGWMTETFKLNQLRDDFIGEREPLVDPCKCHLCSRCAITMGVEEAPEYIEGVCPNCEHKKDNQCIGNQEYVRVIQTASFDNDTLPSDFMQTSAGLMDKKTAAVFLHGKSDDLRDGEVYSAMAQANISGMHIPISLEKDLIWTLDFNFNPQCSVICQEEETSLGFLIKVLDEVVLWNALPEHAAEAFCQLPEVLKWKEANRSVIVYGDPAGLYGTGKDLAPSYYKKIYDVLSKAGFDVRIMMRKPPEDSPLKEPIKIPVAGRIDAVNAMLTTGNGEEATHRIVINKKCKNLLRSLWELKWADDGKSIDHACDKRAARSTDKGKPHLMTHPTDAFGYYVYKRFPVLKNKAGVRFFQIPGEGIIDVGTGELVPLKSKDERRELRRLDRIDRRRKREQIRNERKAAELNNFGTWLKATGKWPMQQRPYGQ